MWAVLLYSACALAGSRGRLIERQVRDMILGRWSEGAMDRSKKKNARLANLNKAKKVQHRSVQLYFSTDVSETVCVHRRKFIVG